MPKLTYRDLNRALPTIRTLAAERHFANQRVTVKAARIKGTADRGFEPVEQAHRTLNETLGETGPVKCPHCRGSLWESDAKRVMPNSPAWGEYQKGVEEALDGGEIAFADTLKLSELVRFVTDQNGKRQYDDEGVVITEPLPLSGEEIDNLGELLEIDEVDGEVAKPTPKKRR